MAQVKTINYYGLDQVDMEKVQASFQAAVESVAKLDMVSEPQGFVKQIFEQDAVEKLLIALSRLPVFDKKFQQAFSQNLDLLAIAKKLKFFTNLPLGQTLLLFQQAMQCYNISMDSYNTALINLNADKFSGVRFKEYVRDQKVLSNNDTYAENNVALEKIDPHAVYPTSIYRHCDGLTLATPDSQTIEAVMSTTLTTTIKITNGVLEPKNKLLADVYVPLGRCVAIIDDKVVTHFGKKLEAYFEHYDIKLLQLVHGGDEVDKDIKNVEKILVELKQNGVARNEPVLIMGGGVIADIAGFATALYHRNTPYVMLCTSIVTGIDAGPSPRTCSDGFGFKNLYGAYHPPVLTITDRGFWSTLHEGWIRHGIAEIIKMAVIEDMSLFELVEKAGPKLIHTKFGSEGDTDEEFQKLCDLIVGKAMEGYVRSEYGNLWETHQCRPHAYGHTWSPGYELPSGMLHGHAISTCMGYGAYLAKVDGFIQEQEFRRIMTLLSDMELSLWHDIMDNHDLIWSANKKLIDKRGGNLCAPVPKPRIGECGYINELSRDKLDKTVDEYKAICKEFVRGGIGIQVHCREVGLQDPSTTAQQAFADIESSSDQEDTQPESYQAWIEQVQKDRNADWEMNVQFEGASDTPNPPEFKSVTLFQDKVEKYAMEQTSTVSKDLQNIAKLTQQNKMFAPCMVGSLESQFLKMQVFAKGAKNCLDIGTFTGMSALAMAEALPKDGKVVTIEFDQEVARVAQQAFDQSSVGEKIELHVSKANDVMKNLKVEGRQFDIIFIDADKENYVEYYELALDGLLAENGLILADNSLCALLYDKTDERSQKLHEFNQHVKNDKRVEQCVLTIREGVTMIRRSSNEALTAVQ